MGLIHGARTRPNYTMWPIVLVQLNLPRQIRYHFANLALVGIIPSQVQRVNPRDLEPFLEVLVDEILYLSGCELHDAYKKAPFIYKRHHLLGS